MRVTTFFSALVLVASLAGAARPVYAQTQSLGDLSKQEEERQKNIKNPAKLYTNKDLNAPPASSVAPAGPEKPAATPAPASPAGDNKTKDAAKDAEGPAKDQKYW